MTNPDPIVFIVDDDEGARQSLVLLLELKGYHARAFATAEAFLADYTPEQSGCLLLDLRMPGMSGLELQTTLKEQGIAIPVIMITAHGDVAAARASLKSGAVDFIEKPLEDEALMTAIRAAFERDTEQRRVASDRDSVLENMARLTERERQVLEMVTAGRHNREIAAALEISPRTVEVYKARMMEKLRVQRIPDLIRLVLTAQGSSK